MLLLQVACWDARLRKPRLFAIANVWGGLDHVVSPGQVVEVYSICGAEGTTEELLGRLVDMGNQPSSTLMGRR